MPVGRRPGRLARCFGSVTCTRDHQVGAEAKKLASSGSAPIHWFQVLPAAGLYGVNLFEPV
jgi:hypothetical protein